MKHQRNIVVSFIAFAALVIFVIAPTFSLPTGTEPIPIRDRQPLVSSWNDIIEDYYESRERSYPIFVPLEIMNRVGLARALDEIDWKVQEVEHWYGSFSGSVYLYNEDSVFGTTLDHGVEALIYEDIDRDQLVVQLLRKGEWTDEVVYKAQPLAPPRGGEYLDAELFHELSERRVVWRITLKSYEQVKKEEAKVLAKAQLASSDGLMMMGMGSGFKITDMAVSSGQVHLTYTGMTSEYYKVYSSSNLLSGTWSIEQILLGEDGTMTTTNSVGNTAAFYRVLQVPTSASEDEDADGMTDVWELENGLDPLESADAAANADNDDLTNLEEFQNGTDPNSSDTDLDWFSDSYELDESTDPLDIEDRPGLVMDINESSFYVMGTVVTVQFEGVVADDVILASDIHFSDAVTNVYSDTLTFNLGNDSNGWQSVRTYFQRSNGTTSEVFGSLVMLDTIPPSLSVTTPSSGLVTSSRWVDIEGLVSDEVGVYR